MNTAAKVREAKEKNPENFCHNSRCLWRTVTRDGIKPCPNHPAKGVKEEPTISVEVSPFDEMAAYQSGRGVHAVNAIEIETNEDERKTTHAELRSSLAELNVNGVPLSTLRSSWPDDMTNADIIEAELGIRQRMEEL